MFMPPRTRRPICRCSILPTARHWFNANIASAAAGVIATNTTSANTVSGTYIQLANGWNNQVTVDLSGLSGVDNDPSFAIRMVNASTGTDCVDTTGAIYNNTSGSWTLDNVVLQGQTIDVVADWDFDLIGVKRAPYNTSGAHHRFGHGGFFGHGQRLYLSAMVQSGAANWCDILAQGGSSTGTEFALAGGFAAGSRAPAPPTAAGTRQLPSAPKEPSLMSARRAIPILFVVSIFISPPRPRIKLCVLYTTDGWVTTNVANSLFYGANPAYILNNASDPNLVIGNYFYQTFGQGWYNNIMVDLTGVPAAANNPLFGFSIVNAATGPQCQNFLGQPYNNLSGNWRFDNVTVGGTAGTPPPAVAFDPNATVDNPFTNTYTDNPAWRTNITAIYVNGLVLTNTAYNTNYCGRNHLQSCEIRPPPDQRSAKHLHHFARVWLGQGVPTACRWGGHETGHHHAGCRPLGQQRHLDRQPRFSRFRPIRQWHHESLRQCHDHCRRRRRRRLDFGWRCPTGVSQRPDRLHQPHSHRERLLPRFRCLHHVHSGWLRCDLQHQFSHFHHWSAAGSVHAGQSGRLSG